MQDNNWKDDAEFYDEAWADMEVRLDKLGTKKAAGYSRWLWLLLLPFLLLAGYLYLRTPDADPRADPVCNASTTENKQRFGADAGAGRRGGSRQKTN